MAVALNLPRFLKSRGGEDCKVEMLRLYMLAFLLLLLSLYMNVIEYRNIIHQLIDTIDNQALLARVEQLLRAETHTENEPEGRYELLEQRLAELPHTTFRSWEETKANIHRRLNLE
jgi:hypothetical protein